MLEISRQQLVVYAAALLAVALIGARYLKSERDPPAQARRRAGEGGALRGRRRGCARGGRGAAPRRVPAAALGAAGGRAAARGRRHGAAPTCRA